MSTNDTEDVSKTIESSKPISLEAISSESQLSASPKSSPETKKSNQGDSPNKNRRKRKPKKVSTSEQQNEISDNERNDLMDIDHELTNKPPDISTAAIKSSAPSRNESDCETIEKIAKMVSNITNVEEKPIVPNTSQELINEVETRLEEMFAEDTNVPQSTTTEEISNKSINTEENNLKNQTLKVIRPKQVKRRKIEENVASKKQQRKKNPNKSKDGKKNDKAGKSKLNGDKNGKHDKHDAKKTQKSKENGSKTKFKNDIAPYLQISKDGSFTIVNQTVNDEDADKTTSKQKKPPITEKHRHIRGLHISTLSNKYDADKRDASWICVFCKLGPHKFKLGDLFGPYIVSKTSSEYSLCLEDPANDIFRQSNKDKFTPVKSPVSTTKKKRKNSDTTPKKLTHPVVNGPDVNDEVFSGMTPVDENSYEIWFHEDCIVWSQGTYIIGTKIVGMEAAVWQSTRHRCEYCQKNGAMIACLSRGCTKEAHVMCASKSWKLCEDFKTYCDQHIL